MEEHQLEETLAHQEQQDLRMSRIESASGEIEQMCNRAEAHCFLGDPKYDFDFQKDSQPGYSRMCSKYL